MTDLAATEGLLELARRTLRDVDAADVQDIEAWLRLVQRALDLTVRLLRQKPHRRAEIERQCDALRAADLADDDPAMLAALKALVDLERETAAAPPRATLPLR